MAIAKLVNVGYQKDATSEPRRAFHYTDKPKTVEKVSSSMFSDSMVSSVIDSIRNYNSQIAKLQDISRNLVISFKGLIVMIRQLNRDITSRFRSLNKELDASRLDFVRSVLTSPVSTPSGTVPLEKAMDQKKEEDKPANKKDDDDKSNFLDGLMGLLGIGRGRAAASGVSLLSRFGALVANPVVAGFIGASTAAVAAIFGAAAVGDWLSKKYGLNEKIAAREKSEEYQELRGAQEAATESAISRNVAPVREMRQVKISEFLKSKGLGGPNGAPRGNEVTVKGDEVTIKADNHPDKGKTFNFMTGQQIGAPEAQTQQAPAAPAATGAPQQAAGEDKPTTPPTQNAGPEGTAPASPPSASSGGVTSAPAAPEASGTRVSIATESELTPEMKSALAAAESAEGPVQPLPMPSEAGPPKSAAARKRETLESLGAPAPAAPAPTAPPAPPETPKMEGAQSSAPVVVNTNNVQATSSSSGGEGNNVSGQNFALSAVDPFIDQYLQQTSQLADSRRSQ